MLSLATCFCTCASCASASSIRSTFESNKHTQMNIPILMHIDTHTPNTCLNLTQNCDFGIVEKSDFSGSFVGLFIC